MFLLLKLTVWRGRQTVLSDPLGRGVAGGATGAWSPLRSKICFGSKLLFFVKMGPSEK